MEEAQEKTLPKIKIGWFSYSCCEDNTIVMTEVMNDHWQEWKKLFDFRHARVLQSHNVFDEFDIAFIEGAIASPEQEEQVKKIRGLAKKVVAVGSCAIFGLPAGQRNNFNENQKKAIGFLVEKFNGLPTVKKLSEVVAVDETIPGCPMEPNVFLQKVETLVSEIRTMQQQTHA